MPQTRFDLDQADHTPGSGSFVSDEELNSASGTLQSNIENAESNAAGDLLAASGVLQADIFRVEDSIFPIASGLDGETIYTLQPEGTETEAKTRIIYDVPVSEYSKNSDIATWWNVRNPQGQAASGVTLFVAWFVDTPAAQDFTLQLRAKTVSAGTNLSSVVETETSVDVSADVDADTIQVTPITLQISPSGSFASLKLTRLGETDAFTNDLFVVANGINYLVI